MIVRSSLMARIMGLFVLFGIPPKLLYLKQKKYLDVEEKKRKFEAQVT